MTTAPNAAPKNIAATAATRLANLGLLPFASEESAPIPVIVGVRAVVVRSGKLISLHRDARGGYWTHSEIGFERAHQINFFKAPG